MLGMLTVQKAARVSVGEGNGLLSLIVWGAVELRVLLGVLLGLMVSSVVDAVIGRCRRGREGGGLVGRIQALCVVEALEELSLRQGIETILSCKTSVAESTGTVSGRFG